MPTLAQSLHGHDLGHLRIIAEHWGVELTALDARTALGELTEALLDRSLIAEIIAALSTDAQNALKMLLNIRRAAALVSVYPQLWRVETHRAWTPGSRTS